MVKEIKVPDIGSFSNVEVIEVLVKPGDMIDKEAGLITLETEKAAMEVPSPMKGKVKEVKVSAGDKVSEGSLILLLEAEGIEEGASKESPSKDSASSKESSTNAGISEEKKETKKAEEKIPSKSTNYKEESTSFENGNGGIFHAGPAVRRIVREFGVDISRIKGTGPKDRVLKTDVQDYVKNILADVQSGRGRQGNGGGASVGGLSIAPLPQVDFAKFGEIEIHSLPRIKKLSGSYLHRNWVMVPHVTQFDEADITNLEEFRKENQKLAEQQGFKLTPLVFLMKAAVAGLKEFPTFNASLDATGAQMVLKKYFHIGVAVDTPNGLVVPVIRDVDQKGLFQLGQELAEVSKKARAGQLKAEEMQGSCFSISSLGGIGGTAFTPIINVPDVAILGVSKSAIKPVYQEGQFVPRLMLPLSLSYDHRIIDGAEGARFSTFLVQQLSDIRRLLL